jgi:predicted TIM-barrel fold metal-dependent hydrolase
MIIDIFCHHLSGRTGKLLEKTKYYGEGKQFPFPSQNTDPEVRLGLMDKYGIDIQAISQTTPILLGLNATDAAELCRISNEDNYALCKAYPDRFVNIGIMSLLDVKSALNELERCIQELDCRGVTLATNQNGKGLDSAEYLPFYEKCAEHELPIFLHGTHWESYPLVDMDKGWRMMHIWGWDFDSTQAVWRLIFGGVLDRYPTLKLITHHLGNMIPYYVRRIEGNVNKFLADKIPRPISEYWGNIYGDTAMDGEMAAFACGYAFFGSDRMLYASDYPFGAEAGEDFIRENLKCVKAMAIPPAEKQKILGENARRLLKIN